jgi:phosphate transport system substrate-binding protein
MKRKSVVFVVLLALSLFVFQVPFAQAAADISVIANGKAVSFDVPPFIENSRVLVPVRAIFEALGASVSWDEATRTVSAIKGDTTISLVIGSNKAYVGESEKTLDVPARIAGGRTFVPVRFVSEALGAEVEWDGGQGQVIINLSVTPGGGSLPATLSGTLIIDGSTSVQPLAEELKTAFVAKYPGVSINISGGGSGVGIADVAAGKVNIGASSRALTSKDPAGLVGTTIAKDAIVVIVNPSNPATGLTTEQVKEIYTGKVTNWKSLNGQDQPIMVYSREAGSGTLDFFSESFLAKAAIVATAKQFNSTNLVKQAVASNQYAVGFISMGYLDSTVKAPDIDGVAATVANAKSGSYKHVRPFVLATNGEPTGLARYFIQYALSAEGQAIVAKEYLTL